jgi:hypothetical protein
MIVSEAKFTKLSDRLPKDSRNVLKSDVDILCRSNPDCHRVSNARTKVPQLAMTMETAWNSALAMESGPVVFSSAGRAAGPLR